MPSLYLLRKKIILKDEPLIILDEETILHVVFATRPLTNMKTVLKIDVNIVTDLVINLPIVLTNPEDN
jgi:hypothetical protein